MRTTPIPSFPLVRDAALEARGLAILELSTRLSHVVRQSETLRLTDRNQLTRHFSLDIDMRRLAERDFLALAANGSWESERQGDVEDEHTWLPVANQTRRELAPIIVTDADGHVVPRMPAGDVASAMAAGLVRLFGLLLRPAIQRAATQLAQPKSLAASDASEAEAERMEAIALLGERVKSVHLLQSALRRLIVDGPAALSSVVDADGADPASHSARIRKDASNGLTALAHRSAGQSFTAFLELLHFCVESYPLMVLLPRSSHPSYLEFQVPSISAATTWRQDVAQVVTPVRNFPVVYWTQASRATDSFHATLEVDDQLKVRRLIASSDFDQPFVDRLISDMRGLARRYDHLESVGVKILENELESISERLAILCDHRLAEERLYVDYLVERGARPVTRPVQPDLEIPLDELLDEFISADDRPLDHLAEFTHGVRQGRFPDLARTAHQEGMNPRRLKKMAKKIAYLELGRDLVVDNDPREHAGHVYWHRTSRYGPERNLEPVQVGIQAILVDDPPSLSGSVARMTTAVAATIAATLVLLFEGWSWLSVTRHPDPVDVTQADAIVTVLLLVPGLMLTRLQIPSTNTVLGQIRSQTRVIAYAAFAAPAALATYVAADSDSVDRLVPLMTFVFLLLLMMYVWISGIWTRWTTRQTAMDALPTPQWVRAQLGRQSFGIQLHRDVVFTASRL